MSSAWWILLSYPLVNDFWIGLTAPMYLVILLDLRFLNGSVEWPLGVEPSSATLFLEGGKTLQCSCQ
jgi:hypothetical protein